MKKEITIGNAWVPKGALIIAGMSLLVTAYVTFKRNEKQYIPIEEIKQLIQEQVQINKNLQQEVDALKSLIKENAKSPDSGNVKH